METSEQTLGKTGLVPHETWHVHDPSKIQTFMACPRDYFYTYVKGWQHIGSNVHLVFGSAWHIAMEHLLTHGYTPANVQIAYHLFCDLYNREIDPGFAIEQDKNPAAALRALLTYVAAWPQDNPEDTLYTEVAGTVPIAEHRLMHFKMDTIRQRPASHPRAGNVYSLEHKTGSRKTKAWEEKWSYLFQVIAYNHVLHTLYPADQVDGVIINGTIIRSKDEDHIRIPVQKSKEMMEAWLWEANHWLDQIEWNFERLAECSPSDRTLVAFPRNSMSCSKFGCKHSALCSVKANPLQLIDPPPGYKCEFWDPRDRESKAKNLVEEGKIIPQAAPPPPGIIV